MPGLYYEEFEVGRRFDHEWTRTVTEMDNLLYSSLTMNVQPLHIDHHFAAQTEFGKPIVNSLFTLGLVIGMSVNDTTFRTTVANLGMSEINFPAPVFAGGCPDAMVPMGRSNSGVEMRVSMSLFGRTSSPSVPA